VNGGLPRFGDVAGRRALGRDTHEDVEMSRFRGKKGIERSRLGRRIFGRAPAANDHPVGPDGVQAAQPELTGLKESVVDVDFANAPIEASDGCDPFAQKGLVIEILRLKVVLTDEESFGPNRFA
jgi:hypothetical protein